MLTGSQQGGQHVLRVCPPVTQWSVDQTSRLRTKTTIKCTQVQLRFACACFVCDNTRALACVQQLCVQPAVDCRELVPTRSRSSRYHTAFLAQLPKPQCESGAVESLAASTSRRRSCVAPLCSASALCIWISSCKANSRPSPWTDRCWSQYP